MKTRDGLRFRKKVLAASVLAIVVMVNSAVVIAAEDEAYYCDWCYFESGHGGGGFSCNVYKIYARNWCCGEGHAYTYCLADGNNQVHNPGWWVHCNTAPQAGKVCECDKWGLNCQVVTPAPE